MNALDQALADIEANGLRSADLHAADKAREVTIEVMFKPDAKRPFSTGPFAVMVTGIAPFLPAKTVGPLTGTSGWTVLGQGYAGRSGMRRTIIKPVDASEHVGLMNNREAMDLCAAIEQALAEHTLQVA